MRRFCVWTFIAAFLAVSIAVPAAEEAPAAAEKAKKERPKLETDLDKVNYSIGVNIAQSLKASEIDVNLPILFMAIEDVFKEKKLALTDEEMQSVMTTFMEQKRKEFQEKTEKDKVENLKKAEAFLAENAKKEGVVTLESGLQYKVIKEGKGESPEATDTIKAHYEGRLLDGTVFDSSYERGQPLERPANQLIKGWTEALQLMKVGSKWELYIPPSLGYGEQGVGQDIPPNSLLIFQLELLDIVK